MLPQIPPTLIFLHHFVELVDLFLELLRQLLNFLVLG